MRQKNLPPLEIHPSTSIVNSFSFIQEEFKAPKAIYNKQIQEVSTLPLKGNAYLPSPIDRLDMIFVANVNLLGKKGNGAYAKIKIPKGTCLGLYTGKEYTQQDLRKTHQNRRIL